MNSISFSIQHFAKNYNSKKQCKNVNILIYKYCPIDNDEEYFIYDNKNNINIKITQTGKISSNSNVNNLWQRASNIGEEITEEQCLGTEISKNDKKCCYIEIYSEENNKKYLAMINI